MQCKERHISCPCYPPLKVKLQVRWKLLSNVCKVDRNVGLLFWAIYFSTAYMLCNFRHETGNDIPHIITPVLATRWPSVSYWDVVRPVEVASQVCGATAGVAGGRLLACARSWAGTGDVFGRGSSWRLGNRATLLVWLEKASPVATSLCILPWFCGWKNCFKIWRW